MKVTDMESDITLFQNLDFVELENRFGADNARTILRTLEQFEGIAEIRVAGLSFSDRLDNVISVMKNNMRFQTRH